jgi:hypothetical protein
MATHFADWGIYEKFIICSLPNSNTRDWHVLEECNVTSLYIFQNVFYPKQLLHRFKIDHVEKRVIVSGIPTLSELVDIVDKIVTDIKTTNIVACVDIHGIICACVLAVMEGLSANDAIMKTKYCRNGVFTKQEHLEMVHKFCNN